MTDYKKIFLIGLTIIILILCLSLLFNGIISSSYGNRTKAFFEIIERISSNTEKINVKRLKENKEVSIHKIIEKREEIDNIIKIFSNAKVADSSMVFNSIGAIYTLQFVDSNNKEIASYTYPNIYFDNLKISIVLSEGEMLEKLIEIDYDTMRHAN